MRQVLVLSFIAVFAWPVVGQDQALRFDGIAKNGPFRLTRILGTPGLHPSFQPTSALSADGKRGVYVEDRTTGGGDDLKLRSRLLIWEVGTHKWPRKIDIDGVVITSLALSQDGAKALLGGHLLATKAKTPHSFLSLFDLEKGTEIRKVLGDDKLISAVAWSTDETAAVAGTEENLRLWDITKNKLRIVPAKEKTAVFAVAFLPGNKQFLAGYRGGAIRLFDCGLDKPIREFKAKDEWIWRLAVSADGKRFASADFKSSVTLWDIAGKEINTLRLEKPTIEEIVTGVTLADDGNTALITWGKASPAADDFACTRLIAWDGDANKIRWSHTVPYRGCAPMLVKDAKLLVGGGPNFFDQWSIKDGKQIRRDGAHIAPIVALAVRGDGDILSAGLDGNLLTWRDGKAVARSTPHAGAITALAVSNDGTESLYASVDRTLSAWPPGAKNPIRIKNAHAGTITALAFNKTGTWAVSGSNDRTAKTWNLQTGKEIASFAGHSEAVNAVAISPDDRWLATGSDDATIKVWPIKDGKLDPDREPITLEKHTKPITCLTFTPDGKRLLSGSQDQKLLVWDWKKGSMDFMIVGHKNWINAILLLDAKTVLTSSDDLSVCAWNLDDGMELGRIDFGTVGDCPRCLAKRGPDRFAVGSSSWLIYEFHLAKLR